MHLRGRPEGLHYEFTRLRGMRLADSEGAPL
jgi:hypothetical protein